MEAGNTKYVVTAGGQPILLDETAGKVKDSVERGVDAVRDTVTDQPPKRRDR